MARKDILQELQRTVDELRVYDEIGKLLTSTLEVGELLRRIMAKVAELLEPANWSLLLLDEEAGELRFEIAVGPFAGTLAGLRIPKDEGIAGWVVTHGEAVLVEDVRKDPRFAARFDETTRFTTGSLLAVPLRFGGRSLGVIELVNEPGQPPFRPSALRTLETIADYAAIGLENARNFQRVQELTVLDEHTGLYNARHLEQALRSEVRRAKRFSHPLSLIFFDLDHFKQVNDRFGHQRGSALLRELGQLVLANLRQVDVVVRYGGDEFVCLLPETPKESALVCTRRLRQAIRSHRFLQEEGNEVRITASFGVATYPDDADSPDELLRRADEAMYRVKTENRDGIYGA